MRNYPIYLKHPTNPDLRGGGTTVVATCLIILMKKQSCLAQKTSHLSLVKDGELPVETELYVQPISMTFFLRWDAKSLHLSLQISS
jgi:hypothetical protein